VIIKKIIDGVLDLFLPNVCIVCGKDTGSSDSAVCQKCCDSIEYIIYPYCVTCFLPLPDGGAHCWKCRKTRYHFEKIVAAGKYTGILRELILKFKEKKILKQTLGAVLLKIIEKQINISDIDALIPVPLSKKREFERGYNQSQLLAEYIGGITNKPVIPGNLIRVKDTIPQFKLTREERLVNLKGAFFVKEPSAVKGKNIILIDDITTTCTTFEECSRILKQAGAGKIFCAALARD